MQTRQLILRLGGEAGIHFCKAPSYLSARVGGFPALQMFMYYQVFTMVTKPQQKLPIGRKQEIFADCSNYAGHKRSLAAVSTCHFVY